VTTPPPFSPAPKRGLAKWFLVACGCLSAVTLVVLLIGYLDREGIISFRKSGATAYFHPADLKSMSLPQWQVTNAIPLTPDQAVLAAMRHLSTNHPSVIVWDVDSIDLRTFDTTWTYNISLIDRRSGRYEFEVVRVLMDGSIWQPTTERRGAMIASPNQALQRTTAAHHGCKRRTLRPPSLSLGRWASLRPYRIALRAN
jgi:hypothetical protein